MKSVMHWPKLNAQRSSGVNWLPLSSDGKLSMILDIATGLINKH